MCVQDTYIYIDRQTDRQTEKHAKLHLLSNLYRVAFLLPNVTNSNDKRRIRTEPTNLFKLI